MPLLVILSRWTKNGRSMCVCDEKIVLLSTYDKDLHWLVRATIGLAISLLLVDMWKKFVNIYDKSPESILKFWRMFERYQLVIVLIWMLVNVSRALSLSLILLNLFGETLYNDSICCLKICLWIKYYGPMTSGSIFKMLYNFE